MITKKSHTCELCNGSGWITEGAGFNARPCVCQRDQRKQHRLAASAIPPRYIHCTLKSFSDRSNVALKRALKASTEFADCWPSFDRGLLIMGGSGAGKTHLAVAVLLEIIESDKPGTLLFSNFQDLIQAIHASFSSEEAPSKSEVLRPLIDADLLVMDELGSQTPSNFVREILYYLINSRYNGQKATIFTTNYSDAPSDPKESTLEQRIGTPLRSRLYEMTEPILIDSSVPDYRRGRSSRLI